MRTFSTFQSPKMKDNQGHQNEQFGLFHDYLFVLVLKT